jgi:hypothetical protein
MLRLDRLVPVGDVAAASAIQLQQFPPLRDIILIRSDRSIAIIRR